MRADIDRWNRKYAVHQGDADAAPDAMLVRHRRLLGGGGCALDLASGTGDNALYLAELGYHSIAIDGSINALRYCMARARARHLPVSALVADLDHFPLPPAYFDVIVVVRYLNRALVDPIKHALRPNGLLFYRTFNVNFLSAKPAFPAAYTLRHGELREWFADMVCVDTNDAPDNHDTDSYWIGRR